MNAAVFDHNAYGAQARAITTPRDLEHQAIARVTGRISRALAATGPAAYPDLVAALDDNARLWTSFAIDLAHPDNGLPDALRAQLLSLAGFTIEHTGKILAGDGNAALLVEINTAVMRGLRQQGAPA
ncbi:MAG: flagellar biosynthesis regulator FlaF [Pararhodobacter sp.]|nr:flagellar biosynthesis regulator FlaF [Pararhodobacter sp.]